MPPRKNHKNKTVKILFSYEIDRGGETVAFENVIQELSKKKYITTEKIEYPTQILYGLVHNALYILKNFYTYAKHTCHRKYDWHISSTYTSVLFFMLIRKVTRSEGAIAWYYHGNRLLFEYINPNQHILRRVSQHIIYRTTKYLHTLAIKNVNLIISPSEYSKDMILDKFPIAKKNKIIIAYNGVDIKKYHKLANKIKIKMKLNIKKNTKVVSYVGRLDPKKGVFNLIVAVKTLIETYTKRNIYLIISYNKTVFPYERTYYSNIRKYVLRNNLTKNVKFIENHSNLNEIYNISNVIVLPTKEDNFPLVLTEAYASGTLAIASNVGGIKELLEKIDGRLLLDNVRPDYLAKRITYFLNLSEKQKRRMLIKSYDLVNNYFTWEKTTNRILKHLTTISF